MAKIEQGKKYYTEICDTCKFSSWVTNIHYHFDLSGNPICLRCPYKRHLIVRGSKSCEKWQKGGKK